MPGNANPPFPPGLPVNPFHPPGQAPVAQDDLFDSIDEDSDLDGNLFADNGAGEDSDPNGDQFFITAVNGQPVTFGVPILVESEVEGRQAELTVSADGSFTLDPVDEFNSLALGDTNTIAFTYTISDGQFSDTATVSVPVDGVNDAPMLLGSVAEAVEGGDPVAVDLSALGSDIDTDDSGATLTYAIVGDPSEGSASIDGTTLTFDPGADFQDLDDGESRDVVIQVQATDSHDEPSNVADITVTVAGVTSGIDVLIANTSGPNKLLRGDGSGNFVVSDLNGGALTSAHIALGDVDGDGDLDALIANAGYGEIDGNIDESGAPNQLLLNDGSGDFVVSDLPGGELTSAYIALGDVDGDGDLDALVANLDTTEGEEGAPNQLLINDGSGNFVASELLGGELNSAVIALGDMDGDGDLDAVVGNLRHSIDEDAFTQLLTNDGSGNFTASDLPGGNVESGSIAIGDVDGDGDLDVLLANAFGTNQLLTNDGTGNFTASELDGGARNSIKVALGDVDGDGDLDAVITNGGGDPNQLLINDGNGDFAASDFLSPDNAVTSGVALGDIDGDGDLDTLIADFFPDAVELWINDGSGDFAAAPNAFVIVDGFSVALGDVDGIGAVDANGFPNINQDGLLPDAPAPDVIA
jgi:VCBS repeat-containing protein